jgi:hypothetical protein
MLMESMLEEKEKTLLLEVEETKHEPTFTSIIVVEVFSKPPGASH